MQSTERTTAVIQHDPFEPLGDDAVLRIVPVSFGGSDGGPVPTPVQDWRFFDGAVAALAVVDARSAKVHGTAVMLAPGLAITATHVLADDLASLATSGSAALLLAPTQTGMDLWRVTGVTATASDITYLSVQLASAVNDEWAIHTLPCTTRLPKAGDELHVVGFRVEDTDVDRQADSMSLAGDLHVASGQVQVLYPHGRDRSLLNYPAIEITCGALGGMSGGAVLSESGHLVGIVSRALATDDGLGPTSAAWIVGALTYPVTLSWPSALGSPTVRVLEIPEGQLFLEGRSAITPQDGNDFTYREWR